MKLSKYAGSLAIVAVAAALGVYAFVDLGKVTDIERAARVEKVFPAFRRQDITRIEIARRHVPGSAEAWSTPGEQETLVLERDSGADASGIDWRMVFPRKETAVVEVVFKLLNAIEEATRVRKVEDSAPGGFDAPRATCVVTMGSVTYRFAIGAPAPVPDGAAYLRLDGEGTFVVKRDFVDALMLPADAYRDRDIVPYLSIGTAKLEVRSKSGDLTLERMNDTDFRLADLGVRASRVTIDKVWSAFAEMRAEAFLSEEEGARATKDPAFTITMTPTDAAKPHGEIVVGGECPGMDTDVAVVRRSPLPVVAACVPKGILEGLSTRESALADQALFSTHPDEVAELKLQASPSGEAIELARSGEGWHERAPADHLLASDEADAASALVSAITRAKGLNARRGAHVAMTPRFRASIVRAEQHGLELVEVGTVDDAGSAPRWVAHRLVDDAVLDLPEEVAHLLEPHAIAVRARTLWVPPIENEPVLALSTSCAATAEELVHDDHGWAMRVRDGARVAADAAGAFDLAEAVARSKAALWVADEDDGSYGLSGTASCKLSASYGSNGGAAVARTIGLTLGAAAHDPSATDEPGVYARIDGDKAVFIVAASLRQMASRLLVDRSAFRVDEDSVASVTLSKPGSAMVKLSRGANGALAAASDGGGVADQAEKIASALDQLRADAVVHLGAAAANEGFDHPALEVHATYASADAGEAARAPAGFVIGSKTNVDGQDMYFARVVGVDATYAIVDDKVGELLKAF